MRVRFWVQGGFGTNSCDDELVRFRVKVNRTKITPRALDVLSAVSLLAAVSFAAECDQRTQQTVFRVAKTS